MTSNIKLILTARYYNQLVSFRDHLVATHPRMSLETLNSVRELDKKIAKTKSILDYWGVEERHLVSV
jgi:hypothetical protein